MKKLFLTLTFFLFVSKKSFSQDYFQKYQPIADSLEKIYGIPSSIMLAVAYIESGGGKSLVAKQSHNHFGIKGKNDRVKSSYKYFENDTASYVGFCDVISRKKFYSNLKGTEDVNKWVYAISNSGYATNSTTWSKKIIYVIKSKNLS
jgi:Bax protein